MVQPVLRYILQSLTAVLLLSKCFRTFFGAIQTGFEVVELSMGWLVPQFKECWWDSLLIDVLGANLIGMGLGLATLRFLENKVCVYIYCILLYAIACCISLLYTIYTTLSREQGVYASIYQYIT
jgi:Phosphatidyl serine synthase